MSLPSSVRSVTGVAGKSKRSCTSEPLQQRPQLPAQDHEQLGEREVLELELEPPGLDLGDVQQVADEPQLVAGRRAG